MAAGPDRGDSPEYAELRNEIDQVERHAVRTFEIGGRSMVIAIAMFVLLVGQVLPWVGDSAGWQILLGQGDLAGRALIVPRLFAATSAAIGVVASALALVTRRWSLAWVCALGGWFAAVDGVFAIWSRQSSAGQDASGPGIGLVLSAVAMVVIAGCWLRTAWSRP